MTQRTSSPNSTSAVIRKTASTAASSRGAAAFLKLMLVFRRVQGFSQSVTEKEGISGAQLSALRQLETNPGLRVSDLAQTLSVRHSSASNLLDKLEEKKLIVRTRDKDDRRVVHLNLTATGKRALKAAPASPHATLLDVFKAMQPSAVSHLENGLDALISALEPQTQGGKLASKKTTEKQKV